MFTIKDFFFYFLALAATCSMEQKHFSNFAEGA